MFSQLFDCTLITDFTLFCLFSYKNTNTQTNFSMFELNYYNDNLFRGLDLVLYTCTHAVVLRSNVFKNFFIHSVFRIHLSNSYIYTFNIVLNNERFYAIYHNQKG